VYNTYGLVQNNYFGKDAKMKTKYFVCLTIIVLLASGSFQFAQAELVELDLLSLGCPSTFNYNQSGWTHNFDLGVQFSDIQHVYMDWEGEITAALIQDTHPVTHEPIGDPHPIDVGLGAHIDKPFDWRYTNTWAGESTYPNPEQFNELSEFINGDLPLSELYDGQGFLGVGYNEYIILNGYYIGGGTIELSELKLVIDGTIIPEPSTLCLYSCYFGISFVKTKLRNKGI